MNEQQFLQQFLHIFTEIRYELRAIADELADLNTALVQVEDVTDE